MRIIIVLVLLCLAMATVAQTPSNLINGAILAPSYQAVKKFIKKRHLMATRLWPDSLLSYGTKNLKNQRSMSRKRLTEL